MNENIQNQKEDEISLIDLFTVILRYRKIIIYVTIASVIVAIIGYFFSPVYVNKNAITDSHDINIEYQVQSVFTVTPGLRSFVSQGLEGLVNSVDVVYNTLIEAGLEDFNGISLIDESVRAKALYEIDRQVSENTGNPKITNFVTRDTNGNIILIDNFTVEISFIYKDYKIVEAFIPALFNQSNEKIKNIYSTVLNDTDVILVKVTEPFITELTGTVSSNIISYRIVAVIIVFGGFFLSLLAAFFLNTIGSIKKDEKTMKKIHEALGKQEDK